MPQTLSPAALRPGPPFTPTWTKAAQRRRAPSQSGIPGPSPGLGPPWPFPPVRHQSLPRLRTPLQASLHRLSGPASSLRPIRVASGTPCPARQSVALAVWHPRPRPSVRSVQPWAVGQASAPQGFPSIPQPHSLALQSTGPPLPIAVSSGVSAPVVYQADTGGPAPSIRLGGPGPGLLALDRASQPRAPAPKQQGYPCPWVRHPRLPSRPSLSVSSVATARPDSLVSVARALPASLQTGPPGLTAPPPPPRHSAPCPLDRPRCGSTCRVGPRLYSAQLGQSRNPSSSPAIWLPVPRAGPCPRPPGLAPRAPGRWAASARCQK